MKGNKFLAAMLAASMAVSMVPATALSVFAGAGDVVITAGQTTTDGSSFSAVTIDDSDPTHGNEQQDVKTYVNSLYAAAGANAWDTDAQAGSIDNVSTIKNATGSVDSAKDAAKTYSTENVTYNASTNKWTVTVKATTTLTPSNYTTYTTTLDSAVTPGAELAAVVTSVAANIDAPYDNTKTQAVNCKAMKASLISAIQAVTGGTVTITKVEYISGASQDSENLGSYKASGITVTGSTGSMYDGTVGSESIIATSSADKLLDAAQALVAANAVVTGATDSSTTADEITSQVQDLLDAQSTDYSSISVSTVIDAKKTTDSNLVGTITLSIGSNTRTIPFNRTINDSALASTIARTAFTGNTYGYTDAIKYNFTTDDSENKSTGLDKAALAAALTKVANTYLSKQTSLAGNPSAQVTIDTYKADSSTGNGYARGQVTVTRNDKEGDSVEFLINAKYTLNVLGYDSAVSTVLKKADNQKLAEAVKALDTEVKADSDLAIKNTLNSTNAPTKSQIVTGVKGVAEAGKGDTKVDSVTVKSYTAPTSTAAGTAVVTVTFAIENDADASKLVKSAHDITLTFNALKAKKTTTLSLGTVPTMWYGSSKANTNNLDTSVDLKDYLNTNGNSELTWSSSDTGVLTVDEDGVVTPTGVGKATVTVTVSDNSKVSATTDITVKSVTKFKDVTNSASYYYYPVVSALAAGITSGISDDEFGVNEPVTRAQFITWLYHKAGDPAVSATSSFTDVSSDSFYAKPVAWALKNGITAGTTPTTFSPDQPLTRAQAMTFLYKYKESPAYNSDLVSSFVDVPTTMFYYDAVQWGYQYGITAGKTPTIFAPDATCTRAEAITFLMKDNI